jgi:hypothetical protein
VGAKVSPASYKTYTWVTGTTAPNPLNDQRLRASVDQRLAARGLAQNAGSADLIVTTNVTSQERRELIPTGFAYGPWWGSYGGAYVDSYVEGTLVLDFYDARTKQTVWRGVATATASDKPTKNMEKMNKALDKMFEKFPITGGPSPRAANSKSSKEPSAAGRQAWWLASRASAT